MAQGTSGQALVSQRPRGGSVGSQHPPGTVAVMGMGMGLGVWQWECWEDAVGLSYCAQRRTAPVGQREPVQALDTGQRRCPARCLALPAISPADNLSLQLDQIQLSAISELASCPCLALLETQDSSLCPFLSLLCSSLQRGCISMGTLGTTLGSGAGTQPLASVLVAASVIRLRCL